MNIYCQFCPHSALQNLLRNRAYISSAVGRLETSLLNVVVVLTSSEKIDMEGVRRILKMSRDGAPLPASKYLNKLLSYTKYWISITEDFQYSLLLLLYIQSQRRKVRLLFDIYNRNDSGWMSRSEIAELLESSINKSGLSVDQALIEDLCETLGSILN